MMIGMLKTSKFLALALVVAMAGNAFGQDQKSISNADPAAIIKILGNLGMDPGDVEVLASGNKRLPISTETGKASVYFYCKGSVCSALQATAGFSMSDKPSLKTINQWNADKRFSRAYLDDDNDPRVESDLDLTGGVQLENVKEFFRTFRTSLKTFAKHINFE